MSEDSPETDSTSATAADDSTSARAVPRASGPAKKSSGKKRSSAAPATKTDKGRVRETRTPAAKTSSASSGGSPARSLTAADYARTTSSSAAATAVMPAVTDVPATPDPEPDREAPAERGSSRRASLRLVRVEPWSVTRLAFVISVAMMIVGVVAVTIFWLVLDLAGVWDQVNDTVTSVLSDDSSSFDITDYLGFGRMVGLTLVLSAINVVLMTALATIGAHLYNLAAQLLGGVEVTFAEED